MRSPSRIAVDAHASRPAVYQASATQVEERALLSVLYVRPLHILRIEVLQRSFESTQYLSISYTERLAEAGIESSIGSVGNSYDNALAESIIGLYKTEVI